VKAVAGATQTELPRAQTVRFYPHRGLGYKREKDHLALEGVDKTLCGISLVPGMSSGTHLPAPFDADAGYSCQRCVRALRRHGPVRVRSRISYWDDGVAAIVTAPATTSAEVSP
jgi:hypothetical protein